MKTSGPRHELRPVESIVDLALDDEALTALAEECWRSAEQVQEPLRVEVHAREALGALVNDQQINWYKHLGARRVIRALLKGGQVLPGRTANPLTARLHTAAWRMMTRLFEFTACDPRKRCEGVCPFPVPVLDGACPFPARELPPRGHCGAATDPSKDCAKSFVFPYFHDDQPNKLKAAKAVARGFRLANIHNMTDDAVRRIFDRYADSH